MPALAIAALRAAGLKLPMPAFEAGIAKADWPARMQRLSHGPLQALAPAGSEIWLDGGHNPEAAARWPPRSATSRSACRARWS